MDLNGPNALWPKLIATLAFVAMVAGRLEADSRCSQRPDRASKRVWGEKCFSD